MLSFSKKHFGTSSVISDQASMCMCSLVSVFCSHHCSVKQLTFEIYIILCQYSYPSFIWGSKYKTKFGEINILDSNFLSSSYGNESHKSVGYGKYTTLNMVLLLQLIGRKQKEVGGSWANFEYYVKFSFWVSVYKQLGLHCKPHHLMIQNTRLL